MIANCEHCGKKFFRKNKNQKMCTVACRNTRNNEKAKQRYHDKKEEIKTENVICLHCGEEFVKRENMKKKFCTNKCAKKHHTNKCAKINPPKKYKNTKEKHCIDCGITIVGLGKLPNRCEFCIALLNKRPATKQTIQQPKPKYTVTEMAKMARDVGMSYGNYCELLRTEGVKT
jgi:hypothetical protein